jgi:exodeoxyribonuclease V alpha subunit
MQTNYPQSVPAKFWQISETIPVTRLTEIFRQAAKSRIITNAHSVNKGQMPELALPKDGETDFYFIEAAEPEDAVSKIVELVKIRIARRFGLDPIRDIQVLCPMQRGGIGARSLNVELQKALNPGSASQPAVERFGYTYRIGDKVMQIENDYEKEVFNGDIGFVASMRSSSATPPRSIRVKGLNTPPWSFRS